MKRITVMASMLMLAAIVLSACGQAGTVPAEGREVKVEGGSYRDITPAQLKSMLKNEDVLLVHVHHECNEEIRDTAFFAKNDDIEQNLSRFVEAKREKIVVYCAYGHDSAPAAETLVSLGFTNVSNLDGGMAEWVEQGYELD